jgi:hypothetical protein
MVDEKVKMWAERKVLRLAALLAEKLAEKSVEPMAEKSAG